MTFSVDEFELDGILTTTILSLDDSSISSTYTTELSFQVRTRRRIMSKKRTLDAFFSPVVKKPRNETNVNSEQTVEEVGTSKAISHIDQF